jgi:hypothetical protein
MRHAGNKKLGLSEAVDSIYTITKALSVTKLSNYVETVIVRYITKILTVITTPTMVQTTVVSAPGKVLIAGGYLVLDPAYSGIVVSTSSRFYTVISDRPSLKPAIVRVRSPQFLEATWSFSVSLDPDVVIEPLQEK